MLLGKVVGTLVATRKEPSLEGLKFLVLRQLDIDGKEISGYRVAAGAGAGRRGRGAPPRRWARPRRPGPLPSCLTPTTCSRTSTALCRRPDGRLNSWVGCLWRCGSG